MTVAKEENKDSLRALKAAISSGQIQNLYVFYGEEVFLLRHYLQRLHDCAVEELTESFNYHRFNGENFDMQSFADEFYLNFIQNTVYINYTIIFTVL